ncbi:MAG: hypothetical protein CM15mP103_09880 [Gammaproteobacteria bacterium]|nr:MAG: hypothetical protein CM15mP103_09880 [Gammaproteobacteria bacterium]
MMVALGVHEAASERTRPRSRAWVGWKSDRAVQGAPRRAEKRHSGGNKWIGTEGTSPFGNDGYHPKASASAVRARTNAP